MVDYAHYHIQNIKPTATQLLMEFLILFDSVTMVFYILFEIKYLFIMLVFLSLSGVVYVRYAAAKQIQ